MDVARLPRLSILLLKFDALLKYKSERSPVVVRAIGNSFLATLVEALPRFAHSCIQAIIDNFVVQEITKLKRKHRKHTANNTHPPVELRSTLLSCFNSSNFTHLEKVITRDSKLQSLLTMPPNITMHI